MLTIKPRYKVSLVEYEGQHRYTINNDPTFLPGVTGILNEINKPFLLQWAAKETSAYWKKQILRVSQMNRTIPLRFYETLEIRAKKQHRFIKESAARIGTSAHQIFDAWIKRAPSAFDPTPFAASFNCWLKNNPLKIAAGDLKIASLQYGYGGSLDLLLEENGKLVVGDFKTGKSIHTNHAYQVASYSYAAKETYGLDYYPEGYIFRFEKDKAQYEMRKIRDIGDSFKAFKAAFDLYQIQQLAHFSERETIKERKIKEKVK